MPQFGMHNETGKGSYFYQVATWKGGLAVGDGDLCFIDASDSSYVKSAAEFPWNGNLATTQADFHDEFYGVSTVRRTTAMTADATSAPEGGVLASGEFCFPCDELQSDTYPSYNSFVTIAQGAGNTLDPQKVVLTTDVTIAIGRLTRPALTGYTSLVFTIEPTTFGVGGIQTKA